MKTLRNLGMAVIISLFAVVANAQTADVTVVIKGIKEAKGKMMVAIGNMSDNNQMVYDMVAVTTTADVVCVLKDVPVGKHNLYVYQDVNDNYVLDKDENNIPVELCYTKEKLSVGQSDNTFEVKLLDVQAMMAKSGGN